MSLEPCQHVVMSSTDVEIKLACENASLGGNMNQLWPSSLILGHDTNVPRNHRKTPPPTILQLQVGSQDMLQRLRLSMAWQPTRHIINVRGLKDLPNHCQFPCKWKVLMMPYVKLTLGSLKTADESPTSKGMLRYLIVTPSQT
jgi:hypothetical protein